MLSSSAWTAAALLYSGGAEASLACSPAIARAQTFMADSCCIAAQTHLVDSCCKLVRSTSAAASSSRKALAIISVLYVQRCATAAAAEDEQSVRRAASRAWSIWALERPDADGALPALLVVAGGHLWR